MAVATKGIMETVGMVGLTKTPAEAWSPHCSVDKRPLMVKSRTRDRVAAFSSNPIIMSKGKRDEL